ncbi:MAG: transcription termination factor NusA [Planctomycetaceae bacterium]|nr:transcription termination factor NusA [Planctomycetaceae bacterium]
MNGPELLRVVEMIHRDKNIEKAIVFEGIEQAILSAARKHFGEETEIDVQIDRESGDVSASIDNDPLDADEIGDLLGRIAAQTAKQVIIKKIREAERDALYDEFIELRSQIVTGSVTRVEGGSVTVSLGKVEGFLPRSEQIPGESFRVGERVRAIIMDVRKAGSRVKIILSRTHVDLVRRLFELEIPEVADHVIEVRSLAREAGYRSKVAVSCFDSKIDCVGACVGVRGSRIKSVVDELVGERIDIVRWNDSLQVLVPNALQPAEVEDVILCPMLGKVIVLVLDDQLSLAIGKKGQNVRLASKLVGWDIHVMTQEKLDEQIDRSMGAFSQIPGVTDELAEDLVVQGFFTFDDLSVIEPDQLAELGGLTEEQCEAIIDVADVEAAREEEREKAQARENARLRREQAELDAMTPPSAKPPRKPAKPAPEAKKPEPEEASDDEEQEAESAQGEDTHTVEAAEDAHDELKAEAEALEAEVEAETDGSDSDTPDLAMGERVPKTPELSDLETVSEESDSTEEDTKPPADAVEAGVGSETSEKSEQE